MDVTDRIERSPPRRLLGSVQRILLPAGCLACGRPLDAGRHRFGLCLPCRGRLREPAPGCAVCGAALPAARLRELAGGFTCSRCRAEPPAYDRLVAAWRYEGPAEAVIRGLKFRRLDYLGGHLAELLAERLTRPAVGGPAGAASAAAGPGEGAGGGAPWDVVVPVPLHWWRRWRRGYNQAERIARPLARRLGVPYRNLLRRRRATRPQARLEREERLRNPRGAFALRRRSPGLSSGVRIAGASQAPHILLVDDVATTGATLGAAAEALVAGGAAVVTAVAAARAP